MPVEIRELIFRTSIEKKNQERSTASDSAESTSCQEENPINQGSNQLSEMSRMFDEQNER